MLKDPYGTLLFCFRIKWVYLWFINCADIINSSLRTYQIFHDSRSLCLDELLFFIIEMRILTFFPCFYFRRDVIKNIVQKRSLFGLVIKFNIILFKSGLQMFHRPQEFLVWHVSFEMKLLFLKTISYNWSAFFFFHYNSVIDIDGKNLIFPNIFWRICRLS